MPGYARRMRSMFFQRRESLEFVRVGSKFQRRRDGRLVELAHVTAVYTDPAGIPHVRFDVAFHRPNRPTYEAGPRALSLASFVATFPDRVHD